MYVCFLNKIIYLSIYKNRMDARRIRTLYETFKGRKVAERVQQINEETHRIKGMYMTK